MRRFAAVCLTLLACEGSARKDKVATGSATPAVSIAAGAPVFGCFAWSAELHAAACLLGTYDRMTANAIDATFEFPGAPDLPTASVQGTIDDATAAKINGVLTARHFGALPPPQAFKSGRISVAPALLLGLFQKEISAASEGTPPTIETSILEYCRDSSITVLADTSPNGTSTATYRLFGADALVELVVESSQEGQYWTHYDATLAAPTACDKAHP